MFCCRKYASLVALGFVTLASMGTPAPYEDPSECHDELDNDGDGLTDEADDDCLGFRPPLDQFFEDEERRLEIAAGETTLLYEVEVTNAGDEPVSLQYASMYVQVEFVHLSGDLTTELEVLGDPGRDSGVVQLSNWGGLFLPLDPMPLEACLAEARNPCTFEAEVNMTLDGTKTAEVRLFTSLSLEGSGGRVDAVFTLVD